MTRYLPPLLLTLAATTLVHAVEPWDWMPRLLTAKYIIYGGDLGDAHAPGKGDMRIAFYVRGSAAKEMFDAIGPDRKSECGIEKGGRVREKERVACRYRPSDGYQCDFGFDLGSGKSIGGTVC